MNRWLPLLLGVVGAPAFAQGFDGHGTVPPPLGAAQADPLTLADATPLQAGELAVGVLVEAAGAPLIAYQQDAGTEEEVCLLCTVGGLDLSAAWSPHDRFGIALVLPLFPVAVGDLGAGVALGDAHLWAPVNLVRTSAGAVTFWPFLSLPTGAADRYLGDGGVGGGALVAATVTGGPVSGAADLGVEVDGGSELAGPRLRSGIGVAVHPAPVLAVGLELRRSGKLVAPALASAEMLATARVRLSDQAGLALAGGPGLTDAPGSAAWRVFAGVTFASRPAEEPLRGDDEAGADVVVVSVVNPDGRPVRDAQVSLQGQELGRTDHTGRVSVPRHLRWDRQPIVESPGLTSALVPEPSDGASSIEVVLAYLPVPTQVRVVDGAGRLLEADIRFDGAGTVDPPERDDVGTFTYALPVGIWTLTTSAPGYSPQERTLVVPAGRTAPMRVDAVLTRAADGAGLMLLTVTDPDGDPIEGALVELGGQVLGTTGSGGDLRVSQLREETTRVRVSQGSYEEADPIDLAITSEGVQPVVTLTHLPGSVEVRVHGPDGYATDALVVLRGPATSLEPVQIGGDGRHVWVLGEGTWTVFVSSPSLGVQERTFEVDHSRRSLLVIEVGLLPNLGPATLELVAVDAAGQPVASAEVELDGETVGRTGTDGTLMVGGLAEGEVEVVLRADRVQPWARKVQLPAGLREIDAMLEWLPGTIQVRALGRDGRPVSGEVRATDGDQTVRARLDLDGTWVDTLPAGSWEVLVSAADLGLQTRSVKVEPDETTLLTIDFRLARAEGDASLKLRLFAPSGDPVSGARVLLDGEDLGTTSNGGALEIASLRGGARRVEVSAPGYLDVAETVDLGQGTTSRDLILPWAPGQLELMVRQDDMAPLTDAVVRIAGDRVLPPLGTDTDGMLHVALTPGEWTVLVSSVTAGLHQQVITLPEGTTEPKRVEMVLERSGSSSLLVRVQDEDGHPIPGVMLGLETGAREATSSGGAALLRGLRPGPGQLTVTPPPPLLPQSIPVEVSVGSDQLSVQLRWPRTATRVQVADDRGVPMRADVLLQGGSVVPVQRTSSVGVLSLDLRPGPWRAFGRMGELEGSASFEVEAGVEQTVDVQLRPTAVQAIGGRFRFDEAVLFDVGQAQLRPAAGPAVKALADHLLADPSIVLAEVQGHTDDTGTMAVNMQLSLDRARTVLEALVAHGVPRERLQARGYAMLRPVALGTDEAARSRNRRVEVLVAQQAAQ